MMDFVSWDDDSHISWIKKKTPNHQPDIFMVSEMGKSWKKIPPSHSHGTLIVGDFPIFQRFHWYLGKSYEFTMISLLPHPMFIQFRLILHRFGDGSKPCTPGEHQNSWDLWMFIPPKMVLIGIDPYPFHHSHGSQGLVTVPFWEYWTSPEKVAIIDHIPNGWVMFNGDI